MRLICPNCDAQYEVVDDVIPAEGRDVQCSNCGQTWFQHHPDHPPEVEEPEEATPDPQPDLQEPDDTPTEDEERSPAPEPQRREVDPAISDILREEAEREAEARAAEALETQPDLGLDGGGEDAERRAREARERMARMRGEDPETEAPDESAEAIATAAAIGSRRDLLPDIEEINSTLRSEGDRQAGDAAAQGDDTDLPVHRKKSGFGRGFFVMVLVVAILVLIYVFAPQIAQSVPQADPYLSSYVAQVDGLRVWLNGQVGAVLAWLDSTAASQTSE